MTKNEFAKIVDAIKTFYPSDKVLPNKQAIQLWYQELLDVPYELAVMSLRKHVNTCKFPPTIAELREGVVEVTTKCENWSDGWEQFRRAVRKFGYYQQQEALDSMDNITRKVVKRLGWQELCMSENLMQDRANFRMIYEQEMQQSKKSDVLPIGLRRQMEALRGESSKRLAEASDTIRRA